ncbi:hypothetical protein BC829DRAFT_406696 [Chytridium lagenaria]|nr:hypothetical protein BC829DRAFT_406696 [Chytridium lagenaria]
MVLTLFFIAQSEWFFFLLLFCYSSFFCHYKEFARLHYFTSQFFLSYHIGYAYYMPILLILNPRFYPSFSLSPTGNPNRSPSDLSRTRRLGYPHWFHHRQSWLWSRPTPIPGDSGWRRKGF